MGSYGHDPDTDYSASGWCRSPSPGFAQEKAPGKEEEEEALTEAEEEEFGLAASYENSLAEVWPGKGKKKGSSGGVMLEGYVDGCEPGSEGGLDGGGVGRTKSLTDDDLDELKGCLDLGFGFCYEDIPELCNTLPALELCYSMSQRFLDEQHQSRAPPESPAAAPEHPNAAAAAASSPMANWKISSPGDHPEEVKARLKYWAQAVACTVRLCS